MSSNENDPGAVELEVAALEAARISATRVPGTAEEPPETPVVPPAGEAEE